MTAAAPAGGSSVFTAGRIGRWPPHLDFFNNLGDGPPFGMRFFGRRL